MSGAQFATPDGSPEQVKESKKIETAMKNKSLVQPQSELYGLVRKLPLKTAKLNGDETEFEWPHSKKELMTMLITNQQSEVKLEKILAKVIKVNDQQMLCGIRLVFSGDQAEPIDLEPPEINLLADVK